MNETEITSLEQYNELEVELHTLANQAKLATTPDKDLMKKLQKMRKFLEDTGKLLRDGYNKKASAVMDKQKELLGIIVPHEDRLKSLKEAEEAEKERKYRISMFNIRSARLGTIGGVLDTGKSEEMDDVQFEAYFQHELAVKNESARLELEARERAVREREEAHAREEQMKAREEKAKQDAEQNAARQIAEANERAARAEQEAREKLEREAAAKIAHEAAEQEKLKKDQMFQDFLDIHGYNPQEFKVEKIPGGAKLWKLVGTYAE